MRQMEHVTGEWGVILWLNAIYSIFHVCEVGYFAFHIYLHIHIRVRIHTHKCILFVKSLSILYILNLNSKSAQTFELCEFIAEINILCQQFLENCHGRSLICCLFSNR